MASLAFRGVLAALIGLGVALLVFAREAQIEERSGEVRSIESRRSRYQMTNHYSVCVGGPQGCASYLLYPADFDPPLPDVVVSRGAPIRLLVVQGTRDVMAIDLGRGLHTSFAFRHPEMRIWWLRLWATALLFWGAIFLAIWRWPGILRRRDTSPPPDPDSLPRRGGGYLVGLVSGLIIMVEAARLFTFPPGGAGQIANGFPPAVLLAFSWPVLVQTALEGLARRSNFLPLVARAEGVATIAGMVAAFLVLVAPFEIVIAWDAWIR